MVLFFSIKTERKIHLGGTGLPTALGMFFYDSSIQMSSSEKTKGCLSPHDFQWVVESRLTLSKWLELMTFQSTVGISCWCSVHGLLS